MNRIIRNVALSFAAVGLAGGLFAQTLADIHSAPSPGTNDIYQLSSTGNQTWPDGLNYFTGNNPSITFVDAGVDSSVAAVVASSARQS